MKKLILALMFISTAAHSQEWVKLMDDPDVNFYTVQQSFNTEYQKHLRKERSFFRKIFRWQEEGEKETPGFEVYKRWEHFNAPRVYPTGNRIRPDHLWNEYQKMQRRSGQEQIQTSGNWVPLGPSSWLTNSYNPGIGRVNVVAVDPTNSSVIYIGSPAGGIWKSIDGGASWQQPTTDYLPSIGVSSIAIDFTNPDVIYIGTGDNDASDTYSNGVLKSTDGGLTWLPTGLSFALTQSRKVCKLLMDPDNNMVLYAATNNGIYKTTNGGISWNNIRSGSFRDMEFRPGNSNVLYASGLSFYKTEDAGNTFTLITLGLPASADINRMCIAVTPDDPMYVYVAAGDDISSGFYGLYRSTDGGNTFTLRSDSPNLYGYAQDGSDSGGQSWYCTTLSVSPNDKDDVLTGGVNIWRSTDGGVNWNIQTHWFYDGAGGPPYVHADQHWMDFEGNELYVGCDGGIFKSSDFGTTWSDLSAGLAISQFYRIAGSELNPGMLLAGAQDNGCNMLLNGQWTHVLGADGMEVEISPVNTQIIFAESQNGNINRSVNGGVTMVDITNSITNQESGAWVTPYTYDPNNDTTLYAGYENVWKSTKNGTGWTKISNFGTSSNVTAIAVAPSNSLYIYIIKVNSVMKTDNGGASWSSLGGLPTGAPTYIAIDNTNPDRLWITFSGFIAGDKVFYSGDGGSTWTNESLNLPNVPVNCIAYQSNSADGLYIGTDLGVFYKNDSLTGWIPFTTDLPNVAVTELEINYTGGKIRAATYGRGVWESDLFVLSPPQANFTADKQHICPGGDIQFTDLSVEAYPGWQWAFPGGNPSSSTLQNPLVNYPNAGVYDVQLIVSNGAGVDTLLQTLYIDVSLPSTTSLPLVEGFESGVFPPASWLLDNPDDAMTWMETNVGGFGTSAHAMVAPNFGQSLPGQKDILFTPLVDLSSLASPWLKFDRAYARIPTRPDSLNIFYTSDCGVTRTYIYGKANAQLANAGVLTTVFTPSASQWISDSVALPASAGVVQIGFENRNAWGNNLYIDNINIYNNIVSVNEVQASNVISISPNPAHDIVHFDVSAVKPASFPLTLHIMDAAGKVISTETVSSNGKKQISVAKWSEGIYLIEGISTTGEKVYSGKLNVVRM